MKIKEDYTFWQMMKNPEIAAKVTLLPVEDLGVDAGILFSDILVIPHALGMGLEFNDNGPLFDQPLAFRDNPLEGLKPDPEKLNYIYSVIDEILRTRDSETPLIGFCGAPLTVLLFMLQGLGRKGEFPEATKFMYQHKEKTRQLIEIVTDLSVIYAQKQIEHGVDVFQLFDTHAGLIPFDLYNELFMPSVRRIAKAVREKNVPFIFFPKGLGTGMAHISPDDCDFLSIDWQTPIDTARKLVHPKIGLQGNVDPRLLYASQPDIEKALQPYIEFGKNNYNWIFNLGHGFMPGISYENALFLANWVKQTDWKRG